MPFPRRIHLALILILLLPGPLAAAERWQLAGPEGGRISSLLLDPSDPQVLYAAAGDGGVFKSLGSGAAWSPVNEGIRGAEVLSLAADPGHPGTVYAGAYSGVFRSDDGGAHWQGYSIRNAGFVGSLVVAPTGIYAVLLTPSSGTPSLLYKSTDLGQTWVSLSVGSLTTIAQDSVDLHLLYAGTYGSGVLHETDGGTAWMGSTRGLPAGASVTALATLPGAVYAAIGGHGVYASTDGGSVWRRVSRGLGGSEVVALAAGPASATLYAVTKTGTSYTLFRTTDAGAHWRQAAGSLPAGFTTLASGPHDGAVYVGTANGVFRSLDAGATWTASQGLRAVPASTVLADPRRPGIAYLTTTDGTPPSLLGASLLKTFEGGASWSRIDGVGASPSLLAIDPQHPATLFLSTGSFQSPGFFQRTRNGGRTWERLGPTTYLLAIDPSQPSVLYRVRDPDTGIERSADAGATWVKDLSPCGSPTALTVTPSSEVFASLSRLCGTSNDSISSLYKRGTDGSWRPVAGFFKLVLDGETFVAADPRQPSTVYFSILTEEPEAPTSSGASSTSGVFRSTDGGATWTFLPDLGAIPARSFAFPPGEPGTVYAALASFPTPDVYRSGDGGQSWSVAGDGIAGLQVLSLSAGPGAPATVYAATQGGLYKLVPDTP